MICFGLNRHRFGICVTKTIPHLLKNPGYLSGLVRYHTAPTVFASDSLQTPRFVLYLLNMSSLPLFLCSWLSSQNQDLD